MKKECAYLFICLGIAWLSLPCHGFERGIPGFDCYRTVEETFDAMSFLDTTYPELVHLNDIGDSWAKTDPGGQPGFDIRVLKITNENIPGPKPVFFLLGTIYGQDYPSPETAMRFGEHLVTDYGTNPDITFFVDYHEIHILPVGNPDARKEAESGYLTEKNTNANYCTGSYMGANLNRNFSFNWGCCGSSSGNECDGSYRGPTPASEPETQAIQDYLLSIFPDQRGPNIDDPAPDDATGLLISIESVGNAVMWPWGFTIEEPPNGNQLQTLGVKLASYSGAVALQHILAYDVEGDNQSFCYGELGVASYSLEKGTMFFEPCESFENILYPDSLNSLLYAMKVAETPYITAFGPETTDADPVNGEVIPDGSISITATVSDTYNGGQTVQGAEFFVLDLHDPIGLTAAPGTGTPMNPADGVWDSAVEDVETILDSTGLSEGEYIVCIRGRDADDNWGTVTAIFLTVTSVPSTPTPGIPIPTTGPTGITILIFTLSAILFIGAIRK